MLGSHEISKSTMLKSKKCLAKITHSNITFIANESCGISTNKETFSTNNCSDISTNIVAYFMKVYTNYINVFYG